MRAIGFGIQNASDDNTLEIPRSNKAMLIMPSQPNARRLEP